MSESESVKARFLFVTEAAVSCSKTTVIHIKRIQIEGEDEIYSFPAHLQELSCHDELMKPVTAKRVKSSFGAPLVRHKHFFPIITLDDKLQKIYLDEDGNPMFNNIMLEEFEEIPVSQKKIFSS